MEVRPLSKAHASIGPRGKEKTPTNSELPPHRCVAEGALWRETCPKNLPVALSDGQSETLGDGVDIYHTIDSMHKTQFFEEVEYRRGL